MTVDDALAGVAADLQEKCVRLGEVAAAELTGKLALFLAEIPAWRFEALLYEHRRRILDGREFDPARARARRALEAQLAAQLPEPRPVVARRIGYGTSAKQAAR